MIKPDPMERASHSCGLGAGNKCRQGSGKSRYCSKGIPWRDVSDLVVVIFTTPGALSSIRPVNSGNAAALAKLAPKQNKPRNKKWIKTREKKDRFGIKALPLCLIAKCLIAVALQNRIRHFRSEEHTSELQSRPHL